VVARAEVRTRRQTPFGQERVDLALRIHGRVRPRADTVDEEAQGVEPGLARLEFETVLLLQLLAESAARGVARVRERGKASLGTQSRLGLVERATARPRFLHRAIAHARLERVELLERGDRDEHLAADLDDPGVPGSGQALRDSGHAHGIAGDILPDAAVTARRRGGEDAVLVAQADRESIDLQLREPAHRTAGR